MKGRLISSTIELFIFLAKTEVDCKLDFCFSQLFELLMVSMIFNFGVGVLKLNPQLLKLDIYVFMHRRGGIRLFYCDLYYFQ